MLTYQDARRLMESARDPYRGKPLANNTRLFGPDADGAYRVQLHCTDVVTLRRNGTCVLRTGGWETVTTADRIRSFGPWQGWGAPLPYAGRSESRGWTVTLRDGSPGAFFDGIRVNAAGVVLAADERKARKLYAANVAQANADRREAARASRLRRKARDRWIAEGPAFLAECAATMDAESAWETVRRAILREDFTYDQRRAVEWAVLPYGHPLRDEAHAIAAARLAAEREAARLARLAAQAARDAALGEHDIPETVRAWADRYGAPLDESTGMLTVVKALTDDLTASHPVERPYEVDAMVTAPDWESVARCGGGLHFCATAELSRGYLSHATRYMRCEVPASATFVIGDKVKAPIAFVVAEVTVDGEVIA